MAQKQTHPVSSRWPNVFRAIGVAAFSSGVTAGILLKTLPSTPAAPAQSSIPVIVLQAPGPAPQAASTVVSTPAVIRIVERQPVQGVQPGGAPNSSVVITVSPTIANSNTNQNTTRVAPATEPSSGL